ncbi:MAG: DivIVA domain-containing protein [Bacteroidota bacterium]
MDILPQDIRHKVFSKKTLGGISNEEVSNYLQQISMEFENLKRQNRSLSNQLIHTNNELSRYRDIENKLFQALEDGKEINAKTKANAEEEASLVVRKAQFRAEQILKEAKNRGQRILEKTEQYCRQRIAATEEKVKVKNEEVEQLEYGRQKVIAELNHFMNKTLNKISQLAEKSAFKSGTQHEVVSPDIDWDFDPHFKEMVKKQPVSKKNTPSEGVKDEHKVTEKNPVSYSTKKNTPLNESFSKPTSIHERFMKNRPEGNSKD